MGGNLERLLLRFCFAEVFHQEGEKVSEKYEKMFVSNTTKKHENPLF